MFKRQYLREYFLKLPFSAMCSIISTTGSVVQCPLLGLWVDGRLPSVIPGLLRRSFLFPPIDFIIHFAIKRLVLGMVEKVVYRSRTNLEMSLYFDRSSLKYEFRILWITSSVSLIVLPTFSIIVFRTFGAFLVSSYFMLHSNGHWSWLTDDSLNMTRLDHSLPSWNSSGW